MYSNIKKDKKTCSYTFNSQRDPSTYVHNVVGTESYTTSTTNMYNKDQRDPSTYVHTVVGTESYTTSTTNMYNKDQRDPSTYVHNVVGTESYTNEYHHHV